MTDVHRIANAISRPRIDPRKFVDLGVVTAVDVTSTGIRVDITTQDGTPETATVAPLYGGPGYGLHLPIDLDRVALLVVPDGVFNSGARVVGTVWDEGDPPPQDAIDNPDDVVLVVKPHQAVRLIVSGGGSVVIDARDDSEILLSGKTITAEAPSIVIEAQDGGTVEIGRPGTPIAPRLPVLSTADGIVFMQALQSAINAQSGNPPGAAALAALQSALVAALWPRGQGGVLVG